MLTKINQITTPDLIEIDKLLEKCRAADGNTIPIYRHLIEKRHPLNCNLLHYINDNLIAYLRSFFFCSDACEITLMVDPQYRRKKIATTLLNEITPMLRHEGIKKLIFSTPAKINSKWLEKLGLAYKNSEFHMKYDLNKSNSEIKTIPGKIRLASSQDIPDLCKIDFSAFPNKKADPDNLFQNLLKTANCTIFVLTLNDATIGKAHIFTEPDKVRLTDIGILPEFRSQGFGSALIKQCIKHALVRNKSNIVLDVETSNEGALKLYQNLGFDIINSHDYWTTTSESDNFGLNGIL